MFASSQVDGFDRYPTATAVALLGTTTYGVPSPFVERQVCSDTAGNVECDPSNAEIAAECGRLTDQGLIIWERTWAADPFTYEYVRCGDVG